jgi:hypothetical protein
VGRLHKGRPKEDEVFGCSDVLHVRRSYLGQATDAPRRENQIANRYYFRMSIQFQNYLQFYLLGLYLFNNQTLQDTTTFTVPFNTASRFWVGFQRAKDAADPDNPFIEMYDTSEAPQSCSCAASDPSGPDGATTDDASGRCFSKDYELRTFDNAKANCEAAGMKLAKFDTKQSFEQVIAI